MVMLYGSAWVRFCVSIIVSHFLTDADEESTHGRTEKQTSRLLAHMSGETPAQEAHTKLRRWQHVGTQTTAASQPHKISPYVVPNSIVTTNMRT